MKLLKLIGALAATVVVAAGSTVALFDDTSPEQSEILFGAGEFELTLVRQSPTRVTFNWTPQAGYGYLFSRDSVLVGSSPDPNRFWATFFTGATEYEVGVQDKGLTGTYPPLAGTLTMSVLAETVDTITFGWTPQAGYGYLFSGDGTVVSRTYNSGRSYAKFAKDYTAYEVAVIVKGDTGVYPPAAPPAGTSRFWIDTTGGTCVRQDPADDYDNDGTECDTIDEALEAASCGDNVLIKAGTYSTAQTISTSNLNACDGNKVVVDEATGETAVFSSYVVINSPAANFELHDIEISGLDNGYSLQVGYHDITATRVRDIRLENLDIKSFVTGYVDNIDIIGGDVGPAPSDTVQHSVIWESGDYAGTDVLVEGVYFHDYTQPGGNHTECLGIWSGERITVRGNTFWNCDSTGAMYVTELNVPGPNGWCLDILIENNFFYTGTPGGGSGPVLQNDCEIVFRNNTLNSGGDLSLEDWTEGADGDGCGDGAGPDCEIDIYGNYGYTQECGPDVSFVFRDNVWVGSSCHASDLNTGSFEVVDVDDNLHLVTLSDAIDNGYVTSYAPTDIDGQNRYLGSGPDAGADERE